jgi:hypothetical protein
MLCSKGNGKMSLKRVQLTFTLAVVLPVTKA